MKFKFSYFRYPNNDQLYPSIVDLTIANESKLVAAYLNDDAGLSRSTRIEILEYSLEVLENIEIKDADISSEHYMASIQNQQVKFEFVYDGNQRAFTCRSKLIQAMKAWIAFIKKESIKDYTEIIEI